MQISDFFSTATRTIITIATTIASISTIAGGVMFVDSRYAHAASLEEIQTTQAVQIRQLKVQNLQLRRVALEDRVFELELKTGSLTPTETALVNRYRQQIRQIDADILNIQQAR